MFSPEEVISVGHLNRTFGVNGGMRVMIEVTFQSLFNDGYQFLFVDMDGEYVPFKIQKWDSKGDQVVYLKNIESIDQAKELTGKPIVIPLKDLPDNYLEDHFNWSDYQLLVDYSIEIEERGHFDIIEIQELPQQLTAIVQFGDEEVMLPLVEAFIVDIDHQSKSIKLGNLPEGLI